MALEKCYRENLFEKITNSTAFYAAK